MNRQFRQYGGGCAPAAAWAFPFDCFRTRSGQSPTQDTERVCFIMEGRPPCRPRPKWAKRRASLPAGREVTVDSPPPHIQHAPMPKPAPRLRRRELANLRRDFARFSRGCAERRPLARLLAYWRAPQYRTLLFYRLWRIVNIPILRAFLYTLYRGGSRRTGLELNPPLGGGLIMPHWGRIILDAESIGNDLYVLHNVTVGSDYATGKPTIGDDVFIGTGAVVIGKIRVGDHVVIAAASLVRSDVPPCSLVAGNPARVIRAITPGAIRDMTHY